MKMKLFYFVILYWGFNLFKVSFALTSNQTCYLKSNGNNFAWRLAWEYNFESNEELGDWTSWHETGVCHGNWYEQESCNINRNVQINSGFLVLQAKHERYNEYKYTGAMVTSKKPISYGRVEVRASQPVGEQFRVCIYTPGPTDMAWKKPGQIAICAQQSKLTRRVNYAEMDFQLFFERTDLFSELADDMNHFHVYGFEWDREWIRFFLDDNYTEIRRFNETHKLHKFFHLRMFIGVGMAKLGQPVPENFLDLHWKCPNFVIDYVRYYEIEISDNQTIQRECQNSKNHGNETLKLENVCQESMKLMPIVLENANFTSKKISKQSRNSNFFLIIGIIITLFVCFFGAFVCLLMKLNTEKRKADKQHHELKQINSQKLKDDTNIYCTVFDDDDYTLPVFDAEPSTSKMQRSKENTMKPTISYEVMLNLAKEAQCKHLSKQANSFGNLSNKDIEEPVKIIQLTRATKSYEEMANLDVQTQYTPISSTRSIPAYENYVPFK